MRSNKNTMFADHANRSPITLSIKLLSLLLIVFMFYGGKTYAMHNDNLIVTDGIFYKADTLQKFTGVTTGKEQFTIENGILEGPYCTWCDRNLESIWEGTYEDFEESFEEKNGRKPTNEEWEKAYEEYLKTL